MKVSFTKLIINTHLKKLKIYHVKVNDVGCVNVRCTMFDVRCVQLPEDISSKKKKTQEEKAINISSSYNNNNIRS